MKHTETGCWRVMQFVIPSALTVARAACLYPLVQYQDDPWISVPVLLTSAGFDILDGWLARRWKTETALGEQLDPFADKFFNLGALLLICRSRVHPGIWITVLMLDLGSTVVRWFSKRYGAKVGANYIGKAKTWIQTIGIGLDLIRSSWVLSHLVFSLGILAAAISLGLHLRGVLRARREKLQALAAPAF